MKVNPFARQPQPQVVYTPFDLSDAQSAGRRRFWKQVLPNTTIRYKGQKIKFDKKYHMDLADAFRKEAFEQVPVVFADGDNRHNMDPRNFGGDVLDMQARPEGLFALVEADEDAAKAIAKNPKLGVSARIRQAVEKADGRKFDRAIEHLCLTMNPRVTGMSPWEAAVDLSDEDADIEVVDLTAEHYEEGTEMARGVKTAKKKAASSKAKGPIDLSALSDEQFEQLLDLADTLVDPAVDEDLDEEDLDEDEDEDEPRRKVKRKKSKTKITVEEDSENDDPEDEDDEDEDEDQDLSDVIRPNERSQFGQMRIDLAQERWDRERSTYIEAGVPPFLLDLAEPVLSLPDALTIDLADDETVDASDTIRQMLDGVKGVIDMTGEIGHQVDLTDEEDSETDAFLQAWDEQYG